jgi:glycosyltransferase involved in cell wall biosynthesis
LSGISAARNSTPVRILFANHTNTVSGAGISLGTLLRNLPRDEVDAYFCLHRRSQLAGRFGASRETIYLDPLLAMKATTTYGAGMPWHLRAFHAAKAPLALGTLAHLKRKWQPDIVHLNETVLVPYALAASRLRLPLVIHARTVVRPESKGMRLLDQMAMKSRVRFVCIDEQTQRSLPPNCRSRSTVVYNPVLMRKVAEVEVLAQRSKWKLPEDAVVVGQAASLHKEKGIWRILDLARVICPQNNRLHFVLCGDTSPARGEGPALQAAIKETGLGNRVHLVGYEEDVALAYAGFDIALCLFGEFLGAVGRAGYEAPLAGKSLVATIPDPRNAEAVVHGRTGLAFEPHDLAGVAHAILELAASEDRRAELGREAKNVIGARHDPVAHARAIIDIYRDLLGES